MESAEEKNWGQRNWKWFVPLVVLLTIGAFVGMALAFVSLIFGMMTSSTPYTVALQAAQQHALVQQGLGTPIEAGYLITGTIEENSNTGKADFQIPIHGPAGEGTIYLNGKKSAGQWHFTQLIVVIKADSQRINLLE